jgi:ribosomal protein L11 methylase PrmA
VGDRVQFLEGDADVLAPLAGPADLILSNILRTANIALLPAISSALTDNGLAIFSGMEQEEGPEFCGALESAGFVSMQETVDTGWWGVAAGRMGKAGKTGKTGR